ncbi:hypothetical protein P691DRAFT_786843 [Macrolepiota fuliginosa MF-IS2]|uniref:Uncharacterized protein n=1 Tax=Macrolepiota fuliginosa MF-IS2 TaxID=1400762 RepID=A0A9P5X6L8_9AGAR|nr:hypothetical protein P691DRAFT_786843 [Macrolepiota fuliginosa MF-IS2]
MPEICGLQDTSHQLSKNSIFSTFSNIAQSTDINTISISITTATTFRSKQHNLANAFTAKSLEEDHLDWEGELKIKEQFVVSGWQAGSVYVKHPLGAIWEYGQKHFYPFIGLDFITLSVAPQDKWTTTLCGIQMVVPVTLVMDPWIQSGFGPRWSLLEIQ